MKYINAIQLRQYRRQKHWTQRDLAYEAGFSEDYISQLERTSTTRNKGTKLETIIRLARALEVPPENLLSQDVDEAPYKDMVQYSALKNIPAVKETQAKVQFSIPPYDVVPQLRQPVQLRTVSIKTEVYTGKKQASSQTHYIHADRLRQYRQRKNWSQRELAHNSGFSEDYISQLEQVPNTRIKGKKLETIIRLAQVLEVPFEALLTNEASEALYTNMPRQDVLTLSTMLSSVESLKGHKPLVSWRIVPSLCFSEEPSKTIAKLLHEAADHIDTQGLWREAEEKALEARAICRAGSEEWAEITLRHCVYMRQQAGDVMGANTYIQDVESQYINALDQPAPHVMAQFHIRHGWIAVEQYGNFKYAYQEFTKALQEARKADDRESERTAHHFRFRTLLEWAMREGGTWLGLRPVRVINQQHLRLLLKSIEEDYPVALRFDPDNPHHYYYKFAASALIRPQEALQEIPKLISVSEQRGTTRFMNINFARWHFSNGEWDTASAHAYEAFQEFCQAAFPPGIALASSIRAGAMLQNGLRTKDDCSVCLDHWILALLLHPYESHPLSNVTRRSLEKTLQYVSDLHPLWVKVYREDIEERVRKKEGVFRLLKHAANANTYVFGSEIGALPHI